MSEEGHKKLEESEKEVRSLRLQLANLRGNVYDLIVSLVEDNANVSDKKSSEVDTLVENLLELYGKDEAN